MSPGYTGKPEYVYFCKNKTDVKSLGKHKFYSEHCDLGIQCLLLEDNWIYCYKFSDQYLFLWGFEEGRTIAFICPYFYASYIKEEVWRGNYITKMSLPTCASLSGPPRFKGSW
jgi:hypothetical protein